MCSRGRFRIAARSSLIVQDAPGTVIQYLAFNLRDPILSNVLVRLQAATRSLKRNRSAQPAREMKGRCRSEHRHASIIPYI
jgi:hypothetical protein